MGIGPGGLEGGGTASAVAGGGCARAGRTDAFGCKHKRGGGEDPGAALGPAGTRPWRGRREGKKDNQGWQSPSRHPRQPRTPLPSTAAIFKSYFSIWS